MAEASLDRARTCVLDLRFVMVKATLTEVLTEVQTWPFQTVRTRRWLWSLPQNMKVPNCSRALLRRGLIREALGNLLDARLGPGLEQ